MAALITADASSSEIEALWRKIAKLELEIANSHKIRGTNSVTHKFAEEVSVMGLSEAIKSKHPVAKVFWGLIFVMCFSTAIYFTYKIFEEYSQNPTATKVGIIRQPYYEYPPLYLCVDSWLNAEKASASGFSKDAINFALSYLIPRNQILPSIPSNTDTTAAKNSFDKAYAEGGFGGLSDFFNAISLDASYVKYGTKQVNDTVIQIACEGCRGESRRPKKIYDSHTCYDIDLHPIGGKAELASSNREAIISIPDVSAGILEPKSYWRLFVAPIKDKLTAGGGFVSIQKGFTHTVTLSSEVYHMVNSPKEPCIADEDVGKLNYSESGCIYDCVHKSIYDTLGCRPFNFDSDHNRHPSEYCNAYDATQGISANNLSSEIQAMVNNGKHCAASCHTECSSRKYDFNVDSHPSTKLTKIQGSKAAVSRINIFSYKKAFSRFQPQINSARIFFVNGDAMPEGVVTFSDVYVYSFLRILVEHAAFGSALAF